MPPIAVADEVTPSSVTVHAATAAGTNESVYVFDFEYNIAGTVRLSVPPLPTGTRLTLRFSEILIGLGGLIQNTYCSWPCPTTCGQADGGNCANQTDTYTSNGVAAQWQPLHTYHGFRYMQLEGWPSDAAAPTKATATALFMRTLVKSTGSVKFPHSPILNKIQAAIVRTQASNLHSIPTDCPQREKRGWMGDAQWTAGQASLTFDMTSFYHNYVR